jgi:general secretion pathway protein A
MEALGRIRDHIEQHTPIVLLVGEPGVGKTTLVTRLLHDLPTTVSPVVQVPVVPLTASATLAGVLGELGCVPDDLSRTAPPQHAAVLAHQLRDLARRRGSPVLVSLEHVLYMSPSALQELLDLLSVHNGGAAGVVTIVIGPPQLALRAARCRPLRERAVPVVTLRPLGADETARYISHLLRWAGGVPTVFTDSAIERIHRCARGLPRIINRLCDLSLLVGFAEERERIDVAQVESAVGELSYVGRLRRTISAPRALSHDPPTALPESPAPKKRAG